MTHNSNSTPSSKATRDDLVALVEWRIGEKPYEHRGRVWAALEQSVYAEILAVNKATIRRWTDDPPFVKAVAQLEHGGRVTLLRIGDPDAAKPEEEIARIMCRDFNAELRAWRKRDQATLAILDKSDPDNKEAAKLRKVLARDQVRSTRRDWGCMCELARQWPPAIAAEAFRYAILNWTETVTSIKVDAAAQGDKLTESRFYRYPLVTLMRKYPQAALAPWLLAKQEKAADKASAAIKWAA